ncbi:MAG: hypothetical protein HYY16_02000 [Planctomycetes bacterium]|nr:hypothetical protein [Planctomycetota bacterium]
MNDVRSIALDVLERARREQAFVDDVLEQARGHELSRRDQALLTTLVLGATRYRLTLDHLAQTISGAREIEPPLRSILQVALYQMLFLRIPHYAAVDAAVRQAPARARKFVNAVLRRVQREIAPAAESPRRLLPRPGAAPLAFRSDIFPEDPVERLAVVHSHPLWLVRRWAQRWGMEKAEGILRVDNVPPPLTVRARIPRDELIARLQAEGVTARAGTRSESVVLERAGDIASLAVFREGLFQVQDETQMGVALRLSGAKLVVDLCAAPGGKAIHLLDLGSKVVAADVSLERLPAARMPADVRVLVADGRRPALKAVFDGALVDAPCSNTGVLGRRADARWRLRPKDVTAMTGVQRALLAAARGLVAPGGRVVYSTCSIEPEENEEVAGPGETTLPTERAGGGFLAVVGGVGRDSEDNRRP